MNTNEHKSISTRCSEGDCLFRYAAEGCGLVCGVESALAERFPLFSPGAVYDAYRKCRRRKRGTLNALRFEANLEENIFSLSHELQIGIYQPGRSVVFLVEKPKRREIFAADFRDRVVHHLLVGYLEPFWERRFIYDSYACRKGKGVQHAVERTQSFCRSVSKNISQRAFFLQLDIKGFFMNIDRRILFDRLVNKEHEPLIQELLRKVVFHDPTDGCVFKRCARVDCEALPEHKTLFHSRPYCGLPIGNLTSQFFANVYLDELDQFVKHTLKCRYYIRYCDDFVLMDESENQLQQWKDRIQEFLRNQLRLELNPKYSLNRLSSGINFLGYIIRSDYMLVRRRVVGNLRERLERVKRSVPTDDAGKSFPAGTMADCQSWLHSYMGHFGKASSHRLKASFFVDYPFLSNWFDEDSLTLRYPPSRNATTLKEQLQYFRRQFREHWIFMRVGRSWRSLPSHSYAALNECLVVPKKIIPSQVDNIKKQLVDFKVSMVWVEQSEQHNGFVCERVVKEIIP